MFRIANQSLVQTRIVQKTLFSSSQIRTIKMAEFSDPSFNFEAYQAKRPRYPELLYETVLDYHQGNHAKVLDLGTGPGLSLFPFAYQFEHLIGTDPSEGMIEQAKVAWEKWKEIEKDSTKIKAKDAKFYQLNAEKLHGIEDESVDLITAAQAAHWFDYSTLWSEMQRVLKPKGTLAFWGYGTNYLPNHPSLADPMGKFMSSKDDEMAKYWPKGRDIAENLLNDIQFPFELDSKHNSQWDVESAKRVQHKLISPGIADLAWTKGEASEERFRMESIRSFDDLNGYFRTSSALSRYYKEHPEAKDKKPDMIDQHVEQIRKTVLEERKNGVAADDGLDDDHVRVAWPLGLMLIRKKE